MDKNDETLKYEVIKELGLFEKVMNNGWKSLTAKETGRIGGIITKKKKFMQAELEKRQQA
ncbi:MAG TPA: small, acid-soluble spore protein, alpha/beta type [Clostridia bacterium]|nr:small, acid-soluble spore protein, alpha/beta type [Clostridia bacterium]